MFVNLWSWFDNYQQEAKESGDALKQRLVALAHEAWDYRRLGDGENAIRAFEEGRSIAKRLNEPCWGLFYQFWIAVIRLYVQSDYQNTLDSTIKLVAEARQEKYRHCPINGSIVYLLAKIYFILDFNAYETEILALLDYLGKEISMDEDTYLQVLVTYAEIEIHYQRYAAAIDKIQNLINQSTNMPYRLYDAYRLLRRMDFIQGDIVSALNDNRLAQEQAQAMRVQHCIADEKLWEAVFLKYLGEDQSAREKYYLALAHYEQYNLPLYGEYHTANTEYLELDRRLAEALKSNEAMIEIANAKPSISNQIDAYCAYIALLGRSARDFSEPLTQARLIANRSLKPEAYLQRLARIEAGNYFEYDWQKTSIKNNSASE